MVTSETSNNIDLRSPLVLKETWGLSFHRRLGAGHWVVVMTCGKECIQYTRGAAMKKLRNRCPDCALFLSLVSSWTVMKANPPDHPVNQEGARAGMAGRVGQTGGDCSALLLLCPLGYELSFTHSFLASEKILFLTLLQVSFPLRHWDFEERSLGFSGVSLLK